MHYTFEKSSVFDIIKSSLWNNDVPSSYVSYEIYREFEQQSIVALPADIIGQLSMPTEVRKLWNLSIIHQVSANNIYQYQQLILPISVPFVVIKGSTVAQYYPHPEYRTMGDIDIITRREDYETACAMLQNDGYQEFTSDKEKEFGRHRTFAKNGVAIEIHYFFSECNNPDYAEFIDNLIIDNINPSHVLPDVVNGLVLIEHICQHLQNGIGLRQIIDWMMFVDKCLPDEKWPEFKPLAEKIGLLKLSIVCTRMCELYLGLSQHKWCASVDVALCDQLMEYIFACGNFGNKKITDTAISENAFAYASTPRMVFKLLQKQGLTNWKAADKHKLLRPFAWMYQAFRYASRGLKRDNAVSQLKAEYSAAKKRNQMFDVLGIKTVAKGVFVYKDGKYVKK